MYRPTKSGMGNSVVRLVFVSFDYFSNFQFPEKSSGRGDMTLCQQRDKKSKVEKATPDTAVAASNDEDMDKAPGQVHQTTSKMSATSSDTNYKQAKIPANEQRQTTTMLKHWPQSVTSVTTKSLDCLNLQTQFPASAWNVTGLCRIHSISVLSAIQRITAAKSVKRLTGKENYVDASKVWKKAISMM